MVGQAPPRGRWIPLGPRLGWVALMFLCVLPACYRQHEAPIRPKIDARAAALMTQAMSALKEGMTDAATEHLQDALALDPELAQAHALLGIIGETRGDARAREHYARAVACYGKLAEAYPRNLEIALDRCVALFLWRGQAEALHAVNQVLRDYPDYQPAATLRERIEKNNRSYFIKKVTQTDPSQRK